MRKASTRVKEKYEKKNKYHYRGALLRLKFFEKS